MGRSLETYFNTISQPKHLDNLRYVTLWEYYDGSKWNESHITKGWFYRAKHKPSELAVKSNPDAKRWRQQPMRLNSGNLHRQRTYAV